MSDNAHLSSLSCSNNQLAELDVSDYTGLTVLYCAGNQLKKLDVSNNTALTELYCGDNQLVELDLSNNTNLEVLFCNNSQLTELDLSNNTLLRTLNCSSNQLTELDLSNNTMLVGMFYNNLQTQLEVFQKDNYWTTDISRIVSHSNLDRITSVSQGNFDAETGIITFDSKVTSFTYTYDVGKDYNAMTVTVTLIEHIHSFSEWQVRTPVSCTKSGLEYRACVCGEEETRKFRQTVILLAHGETTKAPTCTEKAVNSVHVLFARKLKPGI